MKIALIGYGKMGKAIEAIALEQRHEVVLKIDVDNAADFTAEKMALADVAIEFTGPHSAVENILKCLSFGIPVISGSTGWLDQWEKVANYCTEHNGTLIYSSNYSIGVNLFFEVNKYLARLMEQYPSYDVLLKEIHHTQKKDAPSGTAISLAEQVLQGLSRKTNWTNDAVTPNSNLLAIESERIDPAPGTHHVKYTSAIDDIEIIHTAHNRTGFAGGAVTAAEFAIGKKGIYTMKEVLGLP
ncbi:4-hydroxy-tetrahydrodipicolinate reductase [Sediminibacterium sp.]|uniref:4-hydroxy-tetrahydrodipicolinate reductase n=1 Tax=Sediminibacterium sp. TaxID=1917865 RepID=UPI002731DB33|nr:dihydrodipicolinate reductase C-terminal domain-containing protein [Sediminibacterium sp.]MDP2422594.1 dihydrodipicolinate reductase C-terminal domain-containing protein [Sediminibacterium sp.]